MVLLGDVGHVESRFGSFGYNVSVITRLVQVCAKCTIDAWTHPMVLLGDEAQVQARFGPVCDSANLDAR
jgi:hypothetical protein